MSFLLNSAHTIFSSLEVGGVNYGVGGGVRVPQCNGLIQDVTSNSIACNGSPNPTSPSSKVITVQAGQDVTAIWRMAYLKKVSDATSDSGIGGGWFKIQEDGFNSGVWGTEKVVNGQGRHTIRIPSCIAPGQYLLARGAQIWASCVQREEMVGRGRGAGGSSAAYPCTYCYS
ncbi:glycosyl hydrolase family 61-domain-containing protein [Lasiosphaeris hirsuta]|uniref:lytic cellulose monooxygenase (C4-dehydrogenating) n=1 Tax=Lasiosphaeris hirsuta TaxID=260670 RepID=A0AA40AQP6_9PEZI|nr:glycosyl hydrolase family 61-domain-containing protein [Lasiosphaeris hirsuta]